ncbi:uncharacterized protein [Rutidosis leptorrhynchoides]|uniref:uncharacterized protein n=1 Tax=Rutidosis leptorrhynchoides TaxID=125765 RepID=UPI003A994CB2
MNYVLSGFDPPAWIRPSFYKDSNVALFELVDRYSYDGEVESEEVTGGGIKDGSGLALKALETSRTYFSTNFIKGKLKGLIPATVAKSCCCLGMCLKNENIGSHVDYAFEMIFKLDDNIIQQPFVFLDSLFSRLQSCLPSFKLSSGAQFVGYQSSLVLDVDKLNALEEVQLSSSLFKIIKSKDEDGLKHANGEIQEAILISTESHPVSNNAIDYSGFSRPSRKRSRQIR